MALCLEMVEEPKTMDDDLLNFSFEAANTDNDGIDSSFDWIPVFNLTHIINPKRFARIGWLNCLVTISTHW